MEGLHPSPHFRRGWLRWGSIRERIFRILYSFMPHRSLVHFLRFRSNPTKRRSESKAERRHERYRATLHLHRWGVFYCPALWKLLIIRPIVTINNQ